MESARGAAGAEEAGERGRRRSGGGGSGSGRGRRRRLGTRRAIAAAAAAAGAAAATLRPEPEQMVVPCILLSNCLEKPHEERNSKGERDWREAIEKSVSFFFAVHFFLHFFFIFLNFDPPTDLVVALPPRPLLPPRLSPPPRASKPLFPAPSSGPGASRLVSFLLLLGLFFSFRSFLSFAPDGADAAA